MTTTAAPQVQTAGQVARRRWRRSRGIVIAVLALIALGVLLAVLRPSTRPEFLDPQSPGQQGTRALAQLTRQHGTPVTVVRSTPAAVEQLQTHPGSLLVITRTERLIDADLSTLRDAPGDRLLIEPTDDTLNALAPGVTQQLTMGTVTPAPGCALPEATAAGSATFAGSAAYTAPPSATRCYFVTGDQAGLVRLPVGGATVTVLGSGRLLTNERLADSGNAALGMNLLGAHNAVVWLVPDLPPPGGGAHKSFTELVPFGVKLAVLQLVIAVGLVALWRSRRLGPVVVEPLPVIVRSAEAVEGRARLYRARRATDRAAQALRAGSLERLTRLLGMPPNRATDPGSATEIIAALAAHTGYEQAEIAAALYGPPPLENVELVWLAGFLDALERQVRNP